MGSKQILKVNYLLNGMQKKNYLKAKQIKINNTNRKK